MIISKKHRILIATISAVFLLSVQKVQAASLFITSNEQTIHVNDTVEIDVRMNTDGEFINVVEGTVVIDGTKNSYEIREISDAGSDITFWSRKPSVSADQKSITFTGGVPGGVKLENALLFKIFVTARQNARINFIPQNVFSYKNDGKGTVVAQTNKTYTLTLIPPAQAASTVDAWTKIVATDNMPPEFLAVTDGHDESLYDNKIFLTIKATDYQSGIDHFEIQEGDTPFIRTGSEYVLRDQTQQSVVIINAYDKAGNVRTLVIKPQSISSISVGMLAKFIFVGLLVLLTAIFLLVRKARKNKKYNISP